MAKSKTEKRPAKAAKTAKPARKAAQEAAPEPAPIAVYVDFPAQDETVAPGFYTLRIGTVPNCEKVDVSIDGGPWQSCRSAEGYWWYDWTADGSGEHRVIARATSADFSTALSDERTFKVA